MEHRASGMLTPLSTLHHTPVPILFCLTLTWENQRSVLIKSSVSHSIHWPRHLWGFLSYWLLFRSSHFSRSLERGTHPATGYSLVFGKLSNAYFTLFLLTSKKQNQVHFFSLIELHCIKLAHKYGFDFSSLNLLMCVCACEHLQVPAGQKEMLDPLEQELKEFVSCHVGSGIKIHPLQEQ